MRLNLHARIEIGIAAVLLLGSCADERMTPERISERAENADLNAREALNRVNELGERVSDIENDNLKSKADELESRVAEIEARLRM